MKTKTQSYTRRWQELKEERKMCEALRELFADDLRESKEEGIMEGVEL